MSILVVTSFALVFMAAAVVTYSALPSARSVVGRGLPVHRADPAQLPSLIFRLFFPLLDRLAPFFQRVKWTGYRSKMGLDLRRAGIGDAITVNHLFAMKFLTALTVPFLVSRFFVVFTNPALYIAATAASFYLPDRLVTDLRKAREQQILRALPGAVDVLSLSVEAGLEFLTAMQRITERGSIGPLRDEMATILNDIRLGKSRAEALRSFASRVEIPQVSSFVSVLVQADMLGASIGPVLRQQAERMRVERFQRAEKAGARATQKILFPLVLFIFPAVLIVIIGPVALQFVYAR